MSVKPVAWMVFWKGQPTGNVYHIEQDAIECKASLDSKFPDEREVRGLSDAPAPELAEALQRIVENCQDCDGEGTQFYADGRTASGGASESERPCPICTEGRKLLARITPK